MRNRAEIIEINFGVAMAGGASLNLHGRNVLKEHVHMLNDSESAFLLLDEAHKEYAEGIRNECPGLRGIIAVGWESAGVTPYEEWLQKSSGKEPDVVLGPDSLFHLHYTSGTTVNPQGGRQHAPHARSVAGEVFQKSRLPDGHARFHAPRGPHDPCVIQLHRAHVS